MTVGEAQRAAEIVNKAVSERARIIWGCSIEPDLTGTIKILLIITGAKSQYMMDSRGMNAPQASRAAPQYAARSPSPQPQQYQQPRQRDDDIDSVR